MKKYFVSATLLCSLVIAGCGGKDKIDYKSDLAEINIESGETKDTATTKDNGEKSDTEAENADEESFVSEEKVRYWLEMKYGSVCVEGDVVRQGQEGYPEVSVKRKEYTPEEIKQMADSFFDNGEYYQYLDQAEGKINYLQNRITKLEEYNIAYYAEDTGYSYWTQREIDRNNAAIDYKKQNQEFGADLPSSIDFVQEYSEKGQEVRNHKYIYLEGLHNGKVCSMKYMIADDVTFLKIYQNNNQKYGYILQALNEEKMDSINKDLEHWEIEVDKKEIPNEDKSVEVAVETLNKLGLKGYIPIETFLSINELKTNVNTEKVCCEFVYNVVFSREFNAKTKISNTDTWGIFDASYMIFDIDRTPYDNLAAREDYSEQGEYLVVSVDDNGFVRLALMNALDENGTINENTSLMPFEKINDIAKTEMETNGVFDGKEGIVVDTIVLGIGETNKDGDRKIVPVWYYCYTDDKEYKYSNNRNGSKPILFAGESVKKNKKIGCKINAIDGSVIK